MAMDPSISRLMDEASQIELKVAEIYDIFSDLFESDPALCRFWALFAEAERYHSLVLQLQKIMISPQEVSALTLSQWEQGAASMRSRLESVLKRLREEHWRPTVSEAFLIADGIEHEVLEAQSHSFRMVDATEAGELVRCLHEEDSRHRDKLAEARSRFDPAYIAPIDV